MNDKIIEKFAHWTVLSVLVIGSSFIGGVIIVSLSGMGIFALVGNLTVMFTNTQVQVLYGLCTLIAIHLCTGGWWLRGCLNLIDDMNEQHAHAMSRLDVKPRNAVK